VFDSLLNRAHHLEMSLTKAPEDMFITISVGVATRIVVMDSDTVMGATD
jgi:hypothetical protein